MQSGAFRALLAVIAAAFTVAFSVIVLPPLVRSGDVLGALAAGFVNPFASGYSLDVVMCWFVLAVWVAHERRALGVKHGWVAVVLGFVPGVCVGFATYLLMRARQVPDPTARRSR